VVGVVVTFDRARGRGEIESDGRRFGFHSTRIADGTRTIAVGTEVAFELAPGPLGLWEATMIQARATLASADAGATATES